MANEGDELCGAQGRNRTTDTCIFSAVLYQLSYLGPRARESEADKGLREPAVIIARSPGVQNGGCEVYCAGGLPSSRISSSSSSSVTGTT
jgi:hypothetical protein